MAYGVINILGDGETSQLFIEHNCGIGLEVLFIFNSEHEYKTVSMYPYRIIIIELSNVVAK